MLNLIPICCFILISDQAHHSGVICKLDYGVGAINRGAVVGEERVEQRAQHTTLRHASVKGDSGGVETPQFNSLGSVSKEVHNPVA